MSKKQFTLIDTTDLGLTYADYVDFCEANEITPEPEESNDYYNWLGEETNREIEDFFENLRYANCNETPVLITGTLGLWNGRKEIYPMMMESDDYQTKDGKGRYMKPAIYLAVQKCINGMDDFKVEVSEGEIIVHGYHHDGTNVLTINKMSTRGIEMAHNYIENGKRLEPKSYWIAKFRETDLY